MKKIDLFNNPRSIVLLVFLTPFFVSLPCNTYSMTAVGALRLALKILRNTALRRLLNRSVIPESANLKIEKH